MKIAIVHPSLAVKGGAENVVVWLAAELSRRGHTVTVFTSDYDDAFFGPPSAQGFDLVVRDLGGYDVDPFKFVRAGWNLRRDLAGYDWINPHNFPAYHWVYWARVFNRHLGRIVWFCEEPVRWFYPDVCNPHVIEIQRRTARPSTMAVPWWFRAGANVRKGLGYLPRHWKPDVARAIDRRIVRTFDHVFANSEFIASQVRRIFHVPAQPCLLGVPPDRMLAGMDAAPPIAGRYLLTVSRLYVEKNIGMILEAIKLLKSRGPLPFDRYVVAGDGPLRSELLRRAAELGIAEAVEFLGFVSEARLLSLYRHALLVVYVPLDETYGLVFPEAGFCRKPVIGPDHGGPAEIVRHGETGVQVDAMNPVAIVDAITFCLERPHLMAEMGRKAYAYATAELTFSRFVDRFEHLLDQDRSAQPVAVGANGP